MARRKHLSGIVNDTHYDDRTPEQVARVLESARMSKQRICVRYGDPQTGRDWGDPKMCGTIGRSTGSRKVPLLIKTSRSMGGEALLDRNIVRVTESAGGRVLYTHPAYHTSDASVGGLSGIGGFVAGMFGASPSGPHIKVSYSTVTAESAAEGDYAESGWEDEEGMDMTPDQYDVEEGLTAVDKAVSNLRAAGAVEPSSSAYHRGVWYSGDAEEDYRTGESITRAYHLYNFTPEQEREIFDRITKRRR